MLLEHIVNAFSIFCGGLLEKLSPQSTASNVVGQSTGPVVNKPKQHKRV